MVPPIPPEELFIKLHVYLLSATLAILIASLAARILDEEQERMWPAHARQYKEVILMSALSSTALITLSFYRMYLDPCGSLGSSFSMCGGYVELKITRGRLANLSEISFMILMVVAIVNIEANPRGHHCYIALFTAYLILTLIVLRVDPGVPWMLECLLTCSIIWMVYFSAYK